MSVTFRDVATVERGTIQPDGSIGAYSVVASGVALTVWETLKRAATNEGEVYQATAEALVDSLLTVQRRDVLVTRGLRFVVQDVFPGRNLSGLHRFNHVTLRREE